jgi:hypothetical protein
MSRALTGHAEVLQSVVVIVTLYLRLRRVNHVNPSCLWFVYSPCSCKISARDSCEKFTVYFSVSIIRILTAFFIN